jgi:acetoin utilization deacetylase AcuC-like enzyme
VEADDQLSDAQFLRCHDANYYHGFVSDTLPPPLARRIGFTQRPDHAALVARTKLECAATVVAAKQALEYGIAVNCAGGTHHAHRAWGSGFTVLNDLAVAATVLRDASPLRVAIVDLDVHQGDGTAEILAGQPDTFTMSMHCESNFPFGFNQTHLGHDKSDLDVPLPAGTVDAAFMASLSGHLPHVLDTFRPGLVLYDAGIDPFVGDRLGRLALTEAGLFERDHYVFAQCQRRGIPVASVIGGGYDKDRLALARRHAIVHRAAAAVWAHTTGARVY